MSSVPAAAKEEDGDFAWEEVDAGSSGDGAAVQIATPIKAHVVDGSYEQEEEKEKGGVEVAPVAGAGNATELTQMTAGKAEEKSGEAAIVKLDEVGEDWDTWD